MEKAFLQDRLTKNPFQDPLGDDAHQGLERFLDKFHQPGVPGYTLITDPEDYVFLWFHDAQGNLIKCPYLESEYVTFLAQKAPASKLDFGELNKNFASGTGI